MGSCGQGEGGGGSRVPHHTTYVAHIHHANKSALKNANQVGMECFATPTGAVQTQVLVMIAM